MNVNALINSLWNPLKEMILVLWNYIPALLGALLVLLIGAWIAKLLRDLCIKILDLVRIDSLADTIGLTKILEGANIDMPVSVLVPVVAFWAVMLGVLYSAFGVLHVAVLDRAAKLVLDFIPNVLLSVFVLIVGAVLASFVGAVVRLISSLFEFTNDDLLAGFAGYVVNIYAIMIALQYLRLGIDVVNNVLVVVILAAGLAIALGLKDWAGSAVKGLLTAKPKATVLPKKKKR
jgi:hypothetical protein